MSKCCITRLQQYCIKVLNSLHKEQDLDIIIYEGFFLKHTCLLLLESGTIEEKKETQI